MAGGGLIVLAEDDPLMRRLYVDTLSAAGFSVLAAADGVEALSFLSKTTPRLVILDIMMPKLNGIETCERARKIIGGNIPILFLSALDQIDVLRDCLAAGGDDYIIKSDSMETLVERITLWLQHAQRQGLSARRKKKLTDVSANLKSAEPIAPKASPPKKSDSEMANLLALVQDALQYVGPQFGKTPEHRLRLTGYIAGIIEFWSEAHKPPKETSLDYLQAILQATGIVAPEDVAKTAEAYDKLSKDMTFRIGKIRGRDDAARRQKEGPGFRMTGLADAGAAGATGSSVAS